MHYPALTVLFLASPILFSAFFKISCLVLLYHSADCIGLHCVIWFEKWANNMNENMSTSKMLDYNKRSVTDPLPESQGTFGHQHFEPLVLLPLDNTDVETGVMHFKA